MILVVDNVEAIRCVHNQLLSRAGYRVIEASTGEEALLKATSHRPDVIVLDVSLPGIDGFEVCRRLKADRETSPIMVLLQVPSAHSSKIDLTARVDADGYLIEPIEPLELLATVKALMRLADREKENHTLIQQLIRSERQLAAAKLAQYRAIIAAATDGIALIDRKFRYLEQNPAHRVMLGYSDGELIGHTPAIHVEEKVFQQIATKLIDTGRYVGEVRSRRKDGQWVDITLSALGVYDDKGEVQCYVSLGQDITKQKRAQETWRLHDRAINASDAGVLIVDAPATDQPIIFASSGFERLTGYQSAEILGRNCRFLQGPETDRTQIARIRAALQTGEPIRVLLRNYRKDGTAFWNNLSISPVHDTAGCLTHFVGIMND
jgi:two-component system, cell cycle sensor histidine kinase and response regulator CckA